MAEEEDDDELPTVLVVVLCVEEAVTAGEEAEDSTEVGIVVDGVVVMTGGGLGDGTIMFGSCMIFTSAQFLIM